MSQLQIVIDPDEAKRIEKNLILCDIYYRPTGYYSNAKSLLKALKASDACKKEGHWFYLKDVKNWLKRQQLYQIYMPPALHLSIFLELVMAEFHILIKYTKLIYYF